jgi:hypothetical protein
MTLETIIVIAVAAAFACYLVYRWQKAVVDMAIPPYQEPVKPNMVEQWVAATKQTEETLEPTALNPQAVWPFPTGSKP